MTRSIDPFEEYLRKKKVELLEKQYREQIASITEDDEEAAPKKKSLASDAEDPETEARLQEEMDDFFEAGQSAGAQLFNEVTGLDEERVEEIKDALDEVFEEDAPTPKTEENSETFVNFFQQVKDEYDARKGNGGAALVEAEASDAAAPVDAPAAAPADELPAELPVEKPAVDDFDAAAAELAAGDAAQGDDSDASHETRRLNLADILLGDATEATVEQRVEVLCRIVSRLLERHRLPESEIIEALIKSNVEF